MADLHPEVLALIEAGPLKYEGNQFGPETPEEFAHRIAALAMQLEREECAKVCDSVNNYDNPMTATDCADVIRRRGEP